MKFFKSRFKELLLHYLALLITALILIYGAFITTGVGNELYQCYANLFLHGTDYFLTHPETRNYHVCLETVTYANGIHNKLPAEYPIMSLIPMLAPLIFGNAFYTQAMVALLLGTLFATYLLLSAIKSKRAAIVFLLYVCIGGFGIAVERLDSIIGCLILLCLYLAEKKIFWRAYSILAVAALMKIIPIVLILPLFLSEQGKGKMKTLRKYQRVMMFIIIGLVTFSTSLLIDTKGTFLPLQYNSQRPIEVESVPASIMVGLSKMHLVKICYGSGYGSYNMYGDYNGKCNNKSYTAYRTFAQAIITTGTFLFLLGLLFLTKQFLQKKLRLSHFFLASLLLFLSTTKVLSPQYFLWIFPLIAYLYGVDKIWTPLTILLAFLTTLIYPFMFGTTIFFQPNPTWFNETIALRNMILVFVAVAYLFNFYNVRNRDFRSEDI